MSVIVLKITLDSGRLVVILVQVHVLPLDDAYAHTYITDLMNINPNLFLALSAVGCVRTRCSMLSFVVLIIST